MKRKLHSVALSCGTILGLVGAAYYLFFRRPLPKKSGTLKIKGIQEPVEIIRDRWGVPHIYALNQQDGFYAQGYIHAEERLWQMDFNRRLVAGRLSEIFGAASLDVDRWMRTLGMRLVAEQESKLVSGLELEMVQAYINGINERIAQGRLPVEFNLLRYKPEPWSIADTLSWAKMMAWNLSVNWEAELLRALLIEKVGPEKAAQLEPGYIKDWPYIIPSGADFSHLGGESLKRSAKARRSTGPGSYSGLGSNNWVISGNRTESGYPLLANDMHLQLTIPSIWFENHISGGDLEITGVSFPGIPGVLSGHNGYISWGYTNGFPDVQDLFMEKLRHTSEGNIQYEFKGNWLDASIRKETILIRGAEPAVEEVITTHHGPIINSLFAKTGYEQPLALRWTALDVGNILPALRGINHAQNYASFRAALQHWTVPVQNVVYADIEGNIAYLYPGLIPIRHKGDGRLPVPGWSGEYEWDGYIPFDELPHLLNPPPGYIATANNRVVGNDYPYILGSDFVTGNRAQRIDEMINAQEKINLKYIQTMQTDWVSTAARRTNKHICNLQTSDPELENVLRRMRNWDGNLGQQNPEGSVYQVFCIKFLNLILEPRLGKDLTERYMGKGPTPVLSEGSIFAERAREFLEYQLDQSESDWFNLGGGETKSEIMELAFSQAVEYLKIKFGPDMNLWGWGKIHTLSIPHVLGRNPVLGRIFNRGPYPIGGDADTIWNTQATRFDFSQKSIVGPPYRMIIDFSDLSKSVSQLLPGQSGHPASSHYADNISSWINGEYHPMLFRFTDVKKFAEARMRLEPD